MKTWQWLCVIMINGWLMVGGLLADEMITDNGAVIIEELKAKNIDKDFFEKNPEAKLIEKTMTAARYPEVYPEAVSTFAQALNSLHDLNHGLVFYDKKESPNAGKTVHVTPEKQAKYERLKKEFAVTEAKLRQQLLDSGVNPDELNFKLADLIAEKKLAYYKQLFVLDAWTAEERELAKSLEIDALDRHMNNLVEQYGLRLSGITNNHIVINKLIARYGDWQTAAEICESVNTFLRTRGYPHRKIEFIKGALPAKVLIDELARNYPVVVQLKIAGHDQLYLCLIGYTGEISKVNSVFTAFTNNEERDDNLFYVYKEAEATKYIRQIKWNDLIEKVSGYFIFNRKTNKE